MRNLKRALSLALAAIMLLGMMVVGAGAVSYNDFSDRTEIVNKDAVSMLTTLGVIDGKPDGSYAPEEFVTREQMAKMISVIMNQGSDNNDLFVGVPSGLTDVAGNWALGHINYCYSLGIIAGRGDGRFDPTANVTASEAAKMLLVAAGYNPSSEGFVGADWSINVNAKASALGIFRNYTKSTMADLNRDDAALLIYNALDIEMIQKYEDGYAIAYQDHRTILAAMYGVYKVEGVVVANKWAQLQETNSAAALREGRTTLDDVIEYSSTTSSTRVEEGIRYNEPITFNVDTTVDMMGKTVTLFIEKTTILSNSKVLGVALKDDVNVINGTLETESDVEKYLKGTGVAVSTATEYYVNYGYTGDGSEGAKDARDLINIYPNTALGESNDYFNGNGIDVEVIDNNNDGTAEYVLYRQETLSEVNRYNEKSETITFYEKPAIGNDGKLSSRAPAVTIDFEDMVFEEDVDTNDLVLYIQYGGRTYMHLAPIVTGVMTRVDRDQDDQLYITVDGETYHQSYIPDAASMVDVDLTHFDIQNARTTPGFETEYDFIMDSTGENVVAIRPAEETVTNYALVIGSAWTQNALDREGQVKILKADGTEGTYKINWNRSKSAFSDVTSINGVTEVDTTGNNAADTSVGNTHATLTSHMDNDERLEFYLGTRDVNLSEDMGYAAINSAKGSVIEYTLNDDNVLTIRHVFQGNQFVTTPTTSVEIKDNVNVDDTAGVGDNGVVLYLGDADKSAAGNTHNLQYQTNAAYASGSGTLNVTGHTTNESTRTDDKNYAVDLDTVAFYYYIVTGSESPAISGKSAGDIIYGVAVGWDDMSNVANGTSAQVYPVLRKTTDRTYVASNLAGLVLFEAAYATSTSNYALVLDANAATKDTWELNVVFEDGTVKDIIVDDDDLGDFDPDDNGDFKQAWSYSENADGTYKIGSMWSNGRGEAFQIDRQTVAYTRKVPTAGSEQYIAVSNSENVWDVTDVKNSKDTAALTSFTRTTVNAVIITNANDGSLRAAWVWDIPQTSKPSENNPIETVVTKVDADNNLIELRAMDNATDRQAKITEALADRNYTEITYTNAADGEYTVTAKQRVGNTDVNVVFTTKTTWYSSKAIGTVDASTYAPSGGAAGALRNEIPSGTVLTGGGADVAQALFSTVPGNLTGMENYDWAVIVFAGPATADDGGFATKTTVKDANGQVIYEANSSWGAPAAGKTWVGLNFALLMNTDRWGQDSACDRYHPTSLVPSIGTHTGTGDNNTTSCSSHSGFSPLPSGTYTWEVRDTSRGGNTLLESGSFTMN